MLPALEWKVLVRWAGAVSYCSNSEGVTRKQTRRDNIENGPVSDQRLAHVWRDKPFWTQPEGNGERKASKCDIVKEESKPVKIEYLSTSSIMTGNHSTPRKARRHVTSTASSFSFTTRSIAPSSQAYPYHSRTPTSLIVFKSSCLSFISGTASNK
jgi:hypothetical protein